MKQLAIVLIFFSFNSICQEVSFSRLTEEDGLPSSTVRCFLKDKDGFLWIGTASGLCRYDGYEVVSFTQDQGYDIPHEDINTIIQDKNGMIWIGTNVGGLYSFDPIKKNFQSFRHNSNNTESIAGDRIQSLTEGINGEVWIGFDNGIGLSRFDPKSGKSINFDPFINISIPGVKAIRSIVLDKWNPNNLWLGTTSGLILFDLEKENFEIIKHPLTARNRQGLFALEQIDENRLAAGFFHAGTDIYFIKENKWKEIYSDPSEVIRTYDLARRSETEYWVAARKRGLAILDIESGQLSFVESDINNQNTPFPDFTFSVYNDGDRVWVGSKHGVSVSKKATTTFPFTPLKFSSEEFGKVADFSGKFDKIYIAGYHGEGLWEIDKVSQEMNLYPTNVGIPSNVNGMLETKEGIYLVDEERGIFYFNKQTTKTSQINTDPISDKASSFTILESWNPDYAFIITRFGGLFLLNFSSNEIKSLLGGSLENLWMHDALVLKNETWIGTNAAVAFYHHNQDSVSFFYPESISSKNEKHILTLAKDAFGNIWMGTIHGLLKLTDGRETLYTVQNSDLAGNAISQIAFDKQNDLWVTTSKGVTHIDHTTMEMVNYDKSDGIDNEGILESIDGQVYYGDHSGYLVLSNKLEEGKTGPSQVYITDFQVENVSREMSYENNETYHIKLDYWEDSFSFSYASPVFDEPQRLTYAYRLIGLNEEWIYTEKRRFANFTNLDGGHYVFEVKSKTRDSEWSETVKVNINLASPFWETWWFYLACGIVVLSIGFAIYKVRISIVKRKAEKEAQELRIDAFQKRLMDLNATPPDLHIDMEELNAKLQSPLSEREFETLKLSVDGKSNAEISEELFISISTVKFHLTNTYSKLGVSNRKEALDYVKKT